MSYDLSQFGERRKYYEWFMSKRQSIYKAMALQTRCDAVNACADKNAARAIMLKSLTRIEGQILSARAFHGEDLKLVQLPEYFLSGFPMRESADEWRDKACITPDGAIYARIGEIAHKTGTYIGGNAYETDPHFPALYFQASFLFAPNGEMILRYRRLISMYAPSPYDVWDSYTRHYSLEQVFPVVETPLGRIAAIASEEILYPEICRILAARGAEIILHPTSEASGTGMTPKNIAKIARAQENMLYVISANSAGIFGTPLAPASTDGRSQIVDDRGLVLAETGYGESITACADIDITALRHRRARIGMDNRLARSPMALYAELFASLDIHPKGTLGEGQKAPAKEFYKNRQQSVIDKLKQAGIV